MNFGRRLQARLAVPGMPCAQSLGDTFSGEIGLGEDLILVETPEEDLLNSVGGAGDLRYWDEGGAFSVFGDDFGVETSDIQYLIKSGDERIQAVTAAFGRATPAWSAKDPGAFSDFLNDLLALQLRWNTAKTAATSGNVLGALISSGTGGLTSGSSGQAAYDGLLKALKQSAPPDGGPIHKGDFDDLAERIKKAGFAFSWTPQSQPGHGGPASTAITHAPGPTSLPGLPSLPGIPSLGGLPSWLKPYIPNLPDPTGSLLKWWRENEHIIVIGITLIGGLMFAGAILGLVKGAPVAAKVAVKYLPIAA